MAHYYQRERYEEALLVPNSIVVFEHEAASSKTESADAIPVDEPDFYYHQEGESKGAIDFLRRGQYLLHWQMVPAIDQPLAGEIYQLRYLVYDVVSGWVWRPLGGESTHLFPTCSTGFAVVNHTSNEPLTVALWHVSQIDRHLTNMDDETIARLKGRFLCYGLSENDGDLSRIIDRIKYLQENCSFIDLNDLEHRLDLLDVINGEQDEQIINLQNLFEDVELNFDFLQEPSEMIVANCPSPFLGLQVFCQRNGHIYHFTGGTSPLTSSVSFQNGVIYTLLPSSSVQFRGANGNLFQPFLYHTGPWAPGWIIVEASNGTHSYFNFFADAGGLRIRALQSSFNIQAGSTLAFTFHMILAPPQSPTP